MWRVSLPVNGLLICVYRACDALYTAILTTVGLGVALGVVVGVSLLLATLAYCKKCDLFK